VDLVLKPARGKERTIHLEAAGDGKYRATVVPLPAPPGGRAVRLVAQFENSALNATTADRTIKVGSQEVKLSEVDKVQLKPALRVVLQDGKAVEGRVSGLEAVPVRLGEQSVPVDLGKALEVRFGPATEADQVWFTLVVRQGDLEILRQSESVAVQGLLPGPDLAAGRLPKYHMLRLDKVASAVSTKSLFTGADHERLIFPKWGKQEVFDIPFDVIDPKGDSVKNAIALYGPRKAPANEMPTFVRLKCGSTAKAIHLLSGVTGWGYSVEGEKQKTVCVIVRLHYRDGEKEDHELINGVHFCNYHTNSNKRYPELPGSRLAIRLLETGSYPPFIRYLAIQPKNPTKVIEEIEFIKGMKDVSSPVIMAVTVERPVPPAEKAG
jgi:hypothetical protein